MVLPTLRDRLENLDYEIFSSFCANSLDEINKQSYEKFSNLFQMFKSYKKNNSDIIPILR